MVNSQYCCSDFVKSACLLCYIAVFLLCSFLLVVISEDEDDVKCLQGVHKSLRDPHGSLVSWNFSNSTDGYINICNFVGVTCWNETEYHRILSLQIRDFNLVGQVPDALQFCHSLQTLNLSSNSLSGMIPPQICHWIPFLVTLDLSNNNFTGSIPENISECVFLNNLVLDNNKLSGNIPLQFSSLRRLKKFTVSNNDLSGRVPLLPTSGIELDFSGNKGLCGSPLGKCGRLSKKNLAIIIAAGVLGATVSMLIGFWALWWSGPYRYVY